MARATALSVIAVKTRRRPPQPRFVRSFYAALKVGTQTGAVARLFITGVSPILLDDLSSGFNIVTNISTKAPFNLLAGFSRAQLVSLLYYLGMLTLGEQPLDSAVPRLEIPNRVIRELQWEHLAHALAEEDDITIDTTDLEVALKALGVDGDIQPFITLFHERASPADRPSTPASS